MTLFGQYEPCATYFHDSDCVEYVKRDCFTIYDRIDEFLTLIYDESGEVLVGFKLKGFKNVFLRKLKDTFELNDESFVRLVSAIEAIVTQLGNAVFEDASRKRAYRMACDLAANDNVALSGTHIRKLAA